MKERDQNIYMQLKVYSNFFHTILACLELKAAMRLPLDKLLKYDIHTCPEDESLFDSIDYTKRGLSSEAYLKVSRKETNLNPEIRSQLQEVAGRASDLLDEALCILRRTIRTIYGHHSTKAEDLCPFQVGGGDCDSN